jgi:magnesium chelatase family protein
MHSGHTTTAVVLGVHAHVIQVEAVISAGLPSWHIVGLPDTAVNESRDRIRAAAASSGLSWPTGRITVGLSPASIPKRGSGLDLGIALAVLSAAQAVPDPARLSRWMCVGELGLDGTVRSVGSVLPAAVTASRNGIEHLVIPAIHAEEAQLVPGVQLIPVWSLRHLWAVLLGDEETAAAEESRALEHQPPVAEPPDPVRQVDLADVRGQESARDALIVAAAGAHHLCLVGSAGVGKTLLAQRLPSLLPDLNDEDALDASAVKALTEPAGMAHLVRRPPFCSPHHTASDVSLIGGGSADNPRIGLVTRAHTGVLFLDEAAEFSATALDSLRQALEQRSVTVARSGLHVSLPARFQLVLATNPCPCGRALDAAGLPCECSSVQRRRYLGKLAGPLLDRVEVRVQLQRPTAAQLAGMNGSVMTSAEAAEHVRAARERTTARLEGTPWSTNATVPVAHMKNHWPVSIGLQEALDTLAQGRESLRGLDLTLRVAWTYADLSGVEVPDADHLHQALALRNSEGWLV